MADRGLKTADDFEKQCQRLELNPAQIRLHQKRIKKVLTEGKGHFIKIADTCRLDNGGMLPLKPYAKTQKDLSGVISFVPAAGASSRYTQPFASLLNALEEKNLAGVNAALGDLRHKGFDTSIIPHHLKSLLAKPEQTKPDHNLLMEELTQPKAFFPCVVSGESFLDLKILEDQALGFFEGLVIVCNPTFHKRFESYIKEKRPPFKVKIIEQSSSQSTIRFDVNGDPVVDDGTYSSVPAGHGMLAGSLSELQHDFAKSRTALIRNIDNVVGYSQGIRDSIEDFVSLHNIILNHVETIRTRIASDQWSLANDTAKALIKALDLKPTPLPKDSDDDLLRDESLWQLQSCLFHCTPSLVGKAFDTKPGRPTLALLFNRPVNTLGQVPNTLRDVGGTPVFAELDGELFKICLEVPHASEEDRKKFLENPIYATHFNPVFALAELRFDANHYNAAQHSSWLLSKKMFKGETVYYHESVLYELLGNNILANAVFVEIPRTLFNPHKSLEDCKHHTLHDWIKS